MNLRFYKVTYIVTHINYMDWLYTLSRLFNSQLHDSSAVADMIVQQSLARLFNSHWQDYSTVAGMIVQQPLARLFNSHWHDCSTVAGTIVQQSLARFFNSHWHICSTVTGTILQQSLTRLFNSHGQHFFFFFYAGRILQQWNHCWRIVPCTRNTTHDPKMKSKSLAAFSFKEELCFSLICCSLLFFENDIW